MATAGNPRRTNQARSARVQITYDIELEGESHRKELPFVIGVLGDFAGKPDPPLPKLRDREFARVSRDSFNAVLRSMRPRLELNVPNELAADGSKLAVTLHFQALEDFEPEAVARQIEPLRQLIAIREQLSALRTTLRQNGPLGAQLREVMNAAAARRGVHPEAPAPARAAQQRAVTE